jgi:hypothetical protein
MITGRGMDKVKADAQEKGDLGLVAEVSVHTTYNTQYYY